MHQHVQDDEGDVGSRPGDALEPGSQPPADVTHEAQLGQLPAQREEHGEPEIGGECPALLGDVVEGEDARGKECPEAGERDGGEVQAQRPRHDPARHHEGKGYRDNLFVATQGSQRPQSFSGGGGRAGCRAHVRGKQSVQHGREEEDRGESGHRRGHEPRAEIDLQAEMLRYLDPDRIGGRGGEPEGRGDGETRHPAEHEVGAEGTGLGVIRHRASTLREGEDDREEHAPAGGIARERRSNRRIGEEDAVGESKRGAPEGAHHDEADAAPQSRFHDGASDEEGHDHQEHAGVREAREGLGGRDGAREHRGRHRQRRRGEQRKRIHDDGDDGPGEDGEEVPRGLRQPCRHRGEPDTQRQRKGHSPLDDRPELSGGHPH